jgi:hypothetical protein
MTKPNADKAQATVVLPHDEARDLAIAASRCGVPTPEYLGYHVLRSAYGTRHPDVQRFELAQRQPILGQSGTPEEGADD